jgi:hypothetical protein
MFIKTLHKYTLILLILIKISFETPEDTTLIKGKRQTNLWAITKCAIFSTSQRLPDYLVCRNCGADVSLTNFFVNKLSPSAIASINTTLFGEDVLVQEFVNPINLKFIVVLLKRASCSRVELVIMRAYNEFEKNESIKRYS